MLKVPSIHPLTQAATEDVASADDPLRLKGDLDNIGSSSSSEDEDEGQQQGGGGKKKKKKGEDGEESDDGKIYKAPKISQMKYGNDSWPSLLFCSYFRLFIPSPAIYVKFPCLVC